MQSEIWSKEIYPKKETFFRLIGHSQKRKVDAFLFLLLFDKKKFYFKLKYADAYVLLIGVAFEVEILFWIWHF